MYFASVDISCPKSITVEPSSSHTRSGQPAMYSKYQSVSEGSKYNLLASFFKCINFVCMCLLVLSVPKQIVFSEKICLILM